MRFLEFQYDDSTLSSDPFTHLDCVLSDLSELEILHFSVQIYGFTTGLGSYRQLELDRLRELSITYGNHSEYKEFNLISSVSFPKLERFG